MHSRGRRGDAALRPYNDDLIVWICFHFSISYGREDTSVMQQVEKTLREAGFTIWTDRGSYSMS
jgi:hypothetical protein